MRLAIVYSGLANRVGGVPGHIKLLKAALIDSGNSVDVISMESVPFLQRYWIFAVQRVLNLLAAPRGSIFRSARSAAVFKQMYKKKNVSYDGVIFETLWCCFPTTCPSVCLLHALMSDNLQAYTISKRAIEKVRSFEARMLESCPASVVTTSASYRDWILNSLKQFLPDNWNGIRVAPLGVDTDAFKPRGDTRIGNQLRLLYVGNLEARKNLHFLLEVFGEIAGEYENVSLTIIGDGPDKDKLVAKARQLGVSRKVFFLGSMANSQVALEMPKHQIFLLPSLKESFAHVLLEAKLSGLCTIASDGLEVPGEFCDYALQLKKELWVQCLRSIVSQGQLHYDIGKLERLKRFYSHKRMANDLLRLLRN